MFDLVSWLLAALNGLDVMACDLENTYLNAPCMEKIWFEGGLECGSDNVCCCLCFVWFEILQELCVILVLFLL